MQDLMNIHRITQDDLRLLSLFCGIWEMASLEMDSESKISENLFKKRFFKNLSSFLRLEEMNKLRTVFNKLEGLSHTIDLESKLLFDMPKIFVAESDTNDDYSRCLIN